jgi:hypothetical protein
MNSVRAYTKIVNSIPAELSPEWSESANGRKMSGAGASTVTSWERANAQWSGREMCDTLQSCQVTVNKESANYSHSSRGWLPVDSEDSPKLDHRIRVHLRRAKQGKHPEMIAGS